MKPLLKLIRSICLIAIVVLPDFAFAMGTPELAAFAIAYDGQTKPTVAYDASLLSASGYDAALVLVANEGKKP
jgi:hypothetical protein